MEQRSYYGEPYRISAGSDAVSIVGTLLFGVLLGAGIALLMAPKSGADLRREIAGGASRVGEKLSATTSDVTESVRSKINQLGNRAEQLGDQPQEPGNEASDAT